METYNHRIIEKKWQDYWEKNRTFCAKIDPEKEKLYVLDMFPYPSGAGLHVGHLEGYTATDIYSRYQRMKGKNVLHTMGWDAFGLPAEQYAIKTGTHPAVITEKNIQNFKRQIQSLGFSYDWDREINTSEPDYYRWTQWIFLQLYKKGLAYQAETPVNWCPALKAVLANEEVQDGLSVEGGHPVFRKPMRQWVLKITEYADRLLEDLELLDWSESIKFMQRHWIGKSEGAIVRFRVRNGSDSFEVYTTRPDTLFGATFCVLSPEHSLVDSITSEDCREDVRKYQTECSQKSDQERINDKREKTGVFTGAYAINPVNEEAIPIWIADYVLASYGSGAIMAVPGHDQRDYDFAKKYNLQIKEVIQSDEGIKEKAFSGDGKLIHSGFLDGLDFSEAKTRMIAFLEEKGFGKKSIGYRLRDWIFSRQRYWGEPIPVYLDADGNSIPLEKSELPLRLPEMKKFEPAETGESPLANAEEWVNDRSEEGLKRETNTMPQWAGSCWYYLRFLDPKNKDRAWSEEAEKYWGSVDLYVGGAEHAVLHLLYARFWHKVLYDLGHVSHPEPFKKLFNQGMILGEDGVKMSKSRGNVVDPDEIVRDYGADSARMYEMFMGPLEKSKPWQTNGLEGIHRFLNRTWQFFVDENGNLSEERIGDQPAEKDELRVIHRTIKKIGEDIEALKFNTAISQMMICMNEFNRLKKINRQTAKQFILVISPFSPHLAEELWQMCGETESLAHYSWPRYLQEYCEEDQITLPVQINGKVRQKITVSAGISESDALKIAKEDKKIQSYLEGKTCRKVVFIQDKILNLIVG